MNECIEVENLTKRFSGCTVVNHLTFSVKRGEVFGLLGHNGAGKSTVIDCILGLMKPDEGRCALLGMEVTKHRKKLFERVGVQLQHSHYQDNIKVKELCEEMSVLYHHPLNYHEVLQQFGLHHFINHKVDTLSGGEKQKLSLVLAILSNPDVIFLDELTTGLDVAARREVWQILKDLKQKGMTIFLTTHYMEEAQNLCDHIYILKEGKKVVEGNVNSIIEQSPHNNLEDAYLWFIDKEDVV